MIALKKLNNTSHLGHITVKSCNHYSNPYLDYLGSDAGEEEKKNRKTEKGLILKARKEKEGSDKGTDSVIEMPRDKRESRQAGVWLEDMVSSL